MNETVQRYEVIVGGQAYYLKTDGSQDEITQAAAMVEEALNRLTMQAPGIDAKRIAIMVALQMAHRLVAAQSEQSLCRERVDHLISRLEQAMPG